LFSPGTFLFVELPPTLAYLLAGREPVLRLS
jgi:hypothetical protein